MTDTDDEILREFLLESHENLDRLDRDFVALETTPDDRDRIAAIFRTIHTIKGTSGFLGFGRLEALTHVGESLLAKLRDGDLALTPEITTGLLAMVDAVRSILSNVERKGEEGTEDYAELREQLRGLSDGGAAAAPAAPPPPPMQLWTSPAQEEMSASQAPPPAGKSAAPSAAPAKAAVAAPAPPRAVEPQAEPKPEPPKPLELVKAAEPPKAPAFDPHHHEAASGPSVADTSVRVDVDLLDKLMNLVGELVLARNQILQFSVSTRDAALVGTSQRLNLITTELQEGVMKTRMQPIGNVWNKLPRVVRDLSIACGKQVRIDMVGSETELDRTIIEAIKDPLTHIVRNAVDHGIERPADRAARGKDPTGVLSLRAYHAGGQVNIEIGDDGGGLDPEKIRRKAIERGIVSIEQAARMGERDLMKLVFLPGFSTAEKVTNVSGRGVGMDVVKTNIENIGGTLDIESHLGRGTTLKIKIPLTLAIIPALLVTSRNDRFAIPQASLLELVRLEPEQAKAQVEYVHGTPVYRLRGNLLPLVFLARALGEAGPALPNDNQAVNIVVVQADGRQFGLVVDGINDTEEIVVKPLGKELKGLNVFAGATIMGDGKVALILDVVGLAQRASIGGVRERGLTAVTGGRERAEDRQTLLIFRAGREGHMAVPLGMVARLEEFPRERIEHLGNRQVVQYRGEIMPLIDLGEHLTGEPAVTNNSNVVQVIVAAHGAATFGLVVERIVDIVEEQVSMKAAGRRPGISGAAVVQGRVTELLDVPGVLRECVPESLERAS